MALYLWLAAITGARRGEICALQARDIDLERGNLHIAFNYLVKNGQRVRKDTKTHRDRYLAIDPVTSAMLRKHLDVIGPAWPTSALSCLKKPTFLKRPSKV